MADVVNSLGVVRQPAPEPRRVLVTHEDDWMGYYELEGGITLRDATGDLGRRFFEPEPLGFGGRDLALWCGGRLVAAVFRTPEGRIRAVRLGDLP